MKNIKIKEKINNANNWFFEMINKTGKPFTRQAKNKK